MATTTSHWRPQPRQFLSSHTTLMSQLQMSLQATQSRPILGQSSQLRLLQPTKLVPRQLASPLLDPKVKAMQRTQRLQGGSKTAVTMVSTQTPQYLSFDVPIAQMRNPLWVNSSRLPFHIPVNVNNPKSQVPLITLALTYRPGSRHIKTHTLPYRCDFRGCSIGKATQRDLDRHKDTHGKIRLYFCPVPGCPWHVDGHKVGFSRRLDNAKRHLKSHDNSQDLSVLREDSQGRLWRV